MNRDSLEDRVLRLEKLILNESIKLDSITVFDQSSSAREQYVIDQLSSLRNGSRLLGIGDRGYTFIVTKIDDNQYEFNYGNSKDVYKPRILVDNILRDRTDFYEFPRSIKLVKKNAINYDDDKVVVYKNGRKIYSGEEDYEPMKRERWRFNSDFGFYWFIDYSSHSIYIKAKK